MRIIIALAALALAACGQSSAPPAPPEAGDTIATAESTAISTGLMGGISTSAAGDVSAVTIGALEIAFANAQGEETFTLPTDYLGALAPSALIAADDQSFAAAAPSATATRVELRRLHGAAPERLCGGMPATHVALVHAEPLTGLQIMVFTGADAPGPTARDSDVCAIYNYAVD